MISWFLMAIPSPLMRRGELIAQLPAFRRRQRCRRYRECDYCGRFAQRDSMAELYGALSLGLHDYLGKCGFKSRRARAERRDRFGGRGCDRGRCAWARECDGCVDAEPLLFARQDRGMRARWLEISEFNVSRFQSPTPLPLSRRNSRRFLRVCRKTRPKRICNRDCAG